MFICGELFKLNLEYPMFLDIAVAVFLRIMHARPCIWVDMRKWVNLWEKSDWKTNAERLGILQYFLTRDMWQRGSSFARNFWSTHFLWTSFPHYIMLSLRIHGNCISGKYIYPMIFWMISRWNNFWCKKILAFDCGPVENIPRMDA